jgi:hypothetical protein
MTARELELLLDRAQAAMTGMQAAEIESVAAQLTESIAESRYSNTNRLEQLRALALQSAQLWHACLPNDNDPVGYSPEGFVSESSRGMDLSITG